MTSPPARGIPAQALDSRGQQARESHDEQHQRRADGAHQWEMDWSAESGTSLQVDDLADDQHRVEEHQQRAAAHQGQSAPAQPGSDGSPFHFKVA